MSGRGGRTRTDDLVLPKHVRCQLRHTPRCQVLNGGPDHTASSQMLRTSRRPHLTAQLMSSTTRTTSPAHRIRGLDRFRRWPPSAAAVSAAKANLQGQQQPRRRQDKHNQLSYLTLAHGCASRRTTWCCTAHRVADPRLMLAGQSIGRMPYPSRFAEPHFANPGVRARGPVAPCRVRYRTPILASGDQRVARPVVALRRRALKA